MKLRPLQTEDAEYMLEWMHDSEVVSDMHRDFSSMTLEDCMQFIQRSREDQTNLHLAVTDEDGLYMGTVSLKNIDLLEKCAEFAITVRKCAMGRGFAQYGMKKILEKAFFEYQLEYVYWYVQSKNARALRFYDKMHYKRVGNFEMRKIIKNADLTDGLVWYRVLKGERSEKEETVC